MLFPLPNGAAARPNPYVSRLANIASATSIASRGAFRRGAGAGAYPTGASVSFSASSAV
jgi:hypothetical protein